MRNILTLIAVTSAILATAQEKADTILNIPEASRLIMIETSQGMNVIIDGPDANSRGQATYAQLFKHKPVPSQIPCNKRRIPFAFPGDGAEKCDCIYSADKWEGIISGAGIGLTAATGAPEAYDFEMGKSIQITWPMIFGVKYNLSHLNYFSAGIGVGWRNIKTTGSVELTENSYGGVGADFAPSNAPINSRIKIFSLQMPIVFSQRLPWGVGPWAARVSVGPILNLNTHGSVKNGFRDADGNRVQVYDNKIHQRKFTVDAYLSLHVGDVDIYGQYSPMNILQGHHSPTIQPLTVGIGFGMP